MAIEIIKKAICDYCDHQSEDFTDSIPEDWQYFIVKCYLSRESMGECGQGLIQRNEVLLCGYCSDNISVHLKHEEAKRAARYLLKPHFTGWWG